MSSDFSETLDLDLRDLVPVERGLLPDVKLSGDFSLLPKDKSINYSILVSEGNSTIWGCIILDPCKKFHIRLAEIAITNASQKTFNKYAVGVYGFYLGKYGYASRPTKPG